MSARTEKRNSDMIRNLTIASALLLSLAATAASAEESEDCTGAPRAEWLGEDVARTMAAQAGYDVRDLKVEGSCYEIYAMKNDERVEVVMNPSTGEILGHESDDE
jgi:hypothetical protein